LRNPLWFSGFNDSVYYAHSSDLIACRFEIGLTKCQLVCVRKVRKLMKMRVKAERNWMPLLSPRIAGSSRAVKGI